MINKKDCLKEMRRFLRELENQPDGSKEIRVKLANGKSYLIEMNFKEEIITTLRLVLDDVDNEESA